MRNRWITVLLTLGLIAAAFAPIVPSAVPADAAGGRTEISTGAMLGDDYNPRWFYTRTSGGAWQPTYPGTAVEGRLMNFRAANAIFDDEADGGFDPRANTDAFVSNLDAYREHGIMAFTISLQGGNPGYEGARASAFNADGSLKSEWMGRAGQVIEAADARGQIVILTYFYFRQDQVLRDAEAVKQAVRNTTDWLIANNYRNVIVEIANEHNISGFDHDIIKRNETTGGIGELVTLAKSRFDGKGWRLPVSASHAALTFPSALRATADLALPHGNLVDDWQSGEDTYPAMKAIVDGNEIPVVMNEDDNGAQPGETLLKEDTHALDDVLNAGGSWGLMWAEYNQYAPFEWSLGDPNQLSTQDGYFHAILDEVQARVGGEPAGEPAPDAPADGSFTLQYALSADRANPAGLQGATVSGNIYPLATPESGVTSVDFSLDGAPVRSEGNPPFDFGGGSATRADAWDTTSVADGQHTITAVLHLSDGTSTTISATFTVANNSSPQPPTQDPTPTPTTPAPTPTATTPAPTPTTPANDSAYSMKYSTSSKRSNPVALHGATVKGKVYPFTAPDSNVASVEFSLDGKVIRSENNAPFDFWGGSSSTASAWDTTKVADGSHSISAKLTMNDGSTKTASATFTVANKTTAPTATPTTPAPTPTPTTPTPTATPTTPTPTPTSTPTATPTTPAPTPTSTSTPATSTHSIRYSTSADRSGAVNLQGATVSGTIYPFTAPDTGVDSVEFKLDGASVRTEGNPPYDFGGGSAEKADPWNTTNISDGQHTITAVVRMNDGKSTTISATFTVANGQDAPAPSPTSTPTTTPTTTPPSTPIPQPDEPSEVVPGKLNLTPTFNSIGIELPIGNGGATKVQYRTQGGSWSDAFPLWYAGNAYYGSVMFLNAGTTYDVRVTVGSTAYDGSVKTRAEDIVPASQLSPTHYVRVDGNDANSGTSPSAAWKTLERAVKAAPAGAVVQVGAGSFAPPSSARSLPITFVAEYAAVDDAGASINAGKHSVIEPQTMSLPGQGKWTRVTMTGPATGKSYTVWAWKASPVNDATQMTFAPDRASIPHRVGKWDNDAKGWNGYTIATPAGWAEVLYVNQDYNYGFKAFGNDIYARFPGDIDPNKYVIMVENDKYFDITADDYRLSGLEIRQVGPEFQPAADRGIVDHNMIVNTEVYYRGDQSGIYPTNHVVEHNWLVNTGLWDESPSLAGEILPWNFIKGVIPINGQNTTWGRVGDDAETHAIHGRGGGNRLVVRHNVIEGYFNGIGGYNVGYNRYAWNNFDIHDNLFRNIPDDTFEPEEAVINWRIWHNTVEDVAVALSTGPLHYGPIYMVGNTFKDIGNHGVAADNDGNKGANGKGFKYSGGSSPKGQVVVVGNTFVAYASNDNVNGGAQTAGGGSSQEQFYMRNNLFIMTKYAFEYPASWDEDYNQWYTSDPGRGLHRYTKIADYRNATGKGAHSNPAGDIHDPVSVNDPDLVDKGVVVPNLTTHARGSAPDIGASDH